MTSLLKGEPLNLAVEELQAALERQTRILAAMEKRIAHLHEDVRRTGEMTTRLKLEADNAKVLAVSHQELLAALEKRLAAVEPPFEKAAKSLANALAPRRAAPLATQPKSGYEGPVLRRPAAGPDDSEGAAG